MALDRDYIFTIPPLGERVRGLEKLIDRELEMLRLKKDRKEVYLRMIISDNKTGDPELEEALRNTYGFHGWRVGFACTMEGTEILLHE